ncbi:MAG: SPFH domain-containing protein [Gaiellales bacterium]
MTTAIVILVILVGLAASSVRILAEWERGVILRLGRALPGTKGPGLILLIPIIDRMRKVDTRVVTLQVPPQEVITRDNVSTTVTAVILFRVVDAYDAIIRNVDFMYATSQVAQTALRSILGQHSLDQLLAEREEINERLQVVIDSQTAPWGVKVSIVEVKDVEIPEEMRQALAKEAIAERLRRAKVIGAEGEFQASTRLGEAADVLARSPGALQLRYLQTLVEIGQEGNTTTIFPVPMNLLDALGSGLQAAGSRES